ncbi:hypothetical protein DKP76_06190 [Falsochrobactrum shanghaiense]|uniref:Uncharacterized protein n=1 Tax=Falsochrobactrum shanghaiense TaxID=2201899 RepID=A0A316JBD4_9HYPH|nr:hypothetical protein DKP76_06190 [Falsochrobactrum shanghaiense]
MDMSKIQSKDMAERQVLFDFMIMAAFARSIIGLSAQSALFRQGPIRGWPENKTVRAQSPILYEA